jgi:hypothetical protein
MRRTGALAGCLVLLLGAAGCDGKAREFAQRTAALLKQRSAELTAKIKAERTAYQELARVLWDSERTVAAQALLNERNGRSIALAADYTEGRRPVSRWQTDLLDYAQLDYAAHRELLGAGIDATSRYMAGVQALDVEQAKVDAAAKLLELLQKEPSWKAEATAAVEFGKDVKKAIEERCEALKKDKDPVAAEAAENLHCPSK